MIPLRHTLGLTLYAYSACICIYILFLFLIIKWEWNRTRVNLTSLQKRFWNWFCLLKLVELWWVWRKSSTLWHACTKLCAHTYVYACTYTCTLIHVHVHLLCNAIICMHACTHTHTHTHTHSHSNTQPSESYRTGMCGDVGGLYAGGDLSAGLDFITVAG